MKKAWTFLLCSVMASLVGALEFNPQTNKRIDLGKTDTPSSSHRMSIDDTLLKNAGKVGENGLTPVGAWMKEKTYHAGNFHSRELNGMGRTALDDLFKASDRANNVWENDWGVLLEVSSLKQGGSAIFSGGEFLNFSKDVVRPIKGGGKSQGSLGKLLDNSASVEADGYLSLLQDSVLKSPGKFEVTINVPDGSKIRRVVAGDTGVALDYRAGVKSPDIIRLDLGLDAAPPARGLTHPETISKLLNRTGERIAHFGKGIKDYWVGLGESGRVRVGNGLKVEKATENLRFVELPVEDVKGFRRSMSESQLRSVAGKSWEEAARALPGRHADKFTAVEQAWGAAATKSEMAIVVMEPKAGSALEFIMNRTSPKDMFIKSKVDPVTRRVLFDWKNPDHIDLLRTGRYAVHHGDGYKYLFDKQTGKPVSSDFDLGTVGSKTNLGPVMADKDLGYISTADIRAMNVAMKEFDARGYASIPIAHGPQSNVALPIKWGRDRMRGYLPGEARAYIIDSPKALADYLNVGVEKGYKFRIPDQWGAQTFLKPEARNAVKIVSWEELPKLGDKPKLPLLDEAASPQSPPPQAPVPGKMGNEGKISADFFYSAFDGPKTAWQRAGDWLRRKGLAKPRVEVVPTFKTPASTGVGLNPVQADRIQAFADKYQTRVVVVGSRAKNTAKWDSDFDYLINGNSEVMHAARRELPRGAGGGEIGINGKPSGRDFYKDTPLNPELPHVIFDPRKKR